MFAGVPRGGSVLAILLTACATTSGMRRQPVDAGIARTFNAPFERVVAACRNAMVHVEIEVKTAEQVNDTTLMIIGDKGVSTFSAGEKVRIVVQETAKDRSEVRIITKRRLATNIFAKGDWSEDLFEQIQQELGDTTPSP
jgi:hypothetical protein